MYQFNFAKTFNTYGRLSNFCIIPLQSETKPNLQESVQLQGIYVTNNKWAFAKQCTFKFYVSPILPTQVAALFPRVSF